MREAEGAGGEGASGAGGGAGTGGANMRTTASPELGRRAAGAGEWKGEASTETDIAPDPCPYRCYMCLGVRERCGAAVAMSMRGMR